MMQPVDLGVDLYEPTDKPDDSESGVQRRAPYQFGHWVAQPVYKNGLPFVYDKVSGSMWTRSGTPAVAAGWTPERMKQTLEKVRLPDEVRWLHCFRVAPTNDLREFSMVVVDFFHDKMIHAARRDVLEQCFEQIGIRQRVKALSIHLVPEFPDSALLDLWYGLHIMNGEWKEEYYSGIVLKQQTVPYQYQLDDFHTQSLRWHFHKFANPVPDLADALPSTG